MEERDGGGRERNGDGERDAIDLHTFEYKLYRRII